MHSTRQPSTGAPGERPIAGALVSWVLVLAAACAPTESGTSPVLNPASSSGGLFVGPLQAFTTGGPVGGPFEPAEAFHTLSNSGLDSLYWQAETACEGDWLRLSQYTGQLDPGESVRVAASLDQERAAARPAGRHAATLTFKDRSRGRIVARIDVELWVGIEVESDGGLRVRGKRLLPIAFHDVPAASSWVRYFRELGGDVLVGAGEASSPEQVPALLELALENGMLAFLPAGRDALGGQALAGWLLPGAGAGDTAALAEQRARARALAPGLPTLARFDLAEVGTAGPRAAGWATPEIALLDAPAPPHAVTAAGNALARLRTGALPPSRALWATMRVGRDAAGAAPTPAELRFQVWDAMVAGATGIAYRTRSVGSDLPAELDLALEEELVRTNAQVRALTAVLLAPLSSLPLRVEEPQGRAVRWSLRDAGDGQWLIVVNGDADLRTARPTFRFDRPLQGVVVHDEGRTITPDGDGFTDTFGPLGVHLYRLRF